MIYEYGIACVEGLFVVSSMGRPQISFPTLEEARCLLRDIAGLPFQAINYWPELEAEPDTLAVSENADAPTLSIAPPPTMEILIEMDRLGLRVETSQALVNQWAKIYSAAIIRGVGMSLEVS